ncbi:hypothetical protein [Rhodophyticola porphyridii]|uniref:PIN domain-containing protein n=1 Tax=Rhodophyticola porphyridii TaxID=1852017 RepID=A0A3L9XXJ3_9RHOB|nr:hypothetical protein [Rhodophyticola porphyridii]RMA41321.1 hypothetical protein D9R08_15865 [Rhodophyticola porphyridii]
MTLLVTFDWNCVIEVEEQGKQSENVRSLVQMHWDGAREVGLLATSASGNTRSKRFPGNAALFKERVDGLGWSGLPIVPTPKVWGLTYWDWSFWVGDPDEFQESTDQIWAVIAPNVARDPKEHLGGKASVDDEGLQVEKLASWRNTWCDVMSAYSHIHAKRDVFVTLNCKDFQRNARLLAKLGMRDIADPQTLAQRLR